jgi:hypothetical protein
MRARDRAKGGVGVQHARSTSELASPQPALGEQPRDRVRGDAALCGEFEHVEDRPIRSSMASTTS